MFTGLIQTVGEVRARTLKGAKIRIAVGARFQNGPLSVGESIAVDGVCLTVARLTTGGFEADLTRETLSRTTVESWNGGRHVNLERALTASQRLGGHLVQGHVDARASVLAVRADRGQRTLRVATPARLRHLIAEKGSIAVDGVSLTVSTRKEGWFEVVLVPHTLAATTLSLRRAGDGVNLEADLIARYLAQILASKRNGSV